jgi:hypothetical protein
MMDAALYIHDDLPSVSLVPAPIEVLSCLPELNDEVAGEVFGFHFAPLLAPEAEEGGFIIAHYDPGI